MSESENNRFKASTGNSNKKSFDRKRKRSSGLDEADKQKIISHYLPSNAKISENNQDRKGSKWALDFSKIFHSKHPDPIAGSDEIDTEKKGFEYYLDEYEKLRLSYENEGVSQSSIILLQRMANEVNSNPSYVEIYQIPILQELLNISK